MFPSRKPVRPRFTRLLPWACALMLIAGCGGGGESTSPVDPPPPTHPTTPTNPAPDVTLAAVAGSGQHATLSWQGGTAGTLWRLERRAEAGGDFAQVAAVDSGQNLWADSGLSPDAGYTYRLVRPDGSVAATASVRTGTEAALTTAAAVELGAATSVPFTTATRRLATGDDSLAMEIPAGSFAQGGTAELRLLANPLPEGLGVGTGLRLRLPERPAKPLTVSLRYGVEEDTDEVLQDRIAVSQGDGSWWVLPLLAHDASQRLLQVSLPVSLWQAQPAVSAQGVRALAAQGGVKLDVLRVKAHRLVPDQARVRVLGSQRFVPVSIYAVRGNSTPCDNLAEGDLCVPVPIVKDVELPILNTKPGFQRRWLLEGSATPAPALGSITPAARSGVVYTAPAEVPAAQPLTLRFESLNTNNGKRLVLSARIRVTEDAWVGTLQTRVGVDGANHLFEATTRWRLDGAQSTATRRVYRPDGEVNHTYTIADPVCTHAVTPAHLTLADAHGLGELVVDEFTSPARYALSLSVYWDSVLTVTCPKGSVRSATLGASVWRAEGVVGAGEHIAGAVAAPAAQAWSLGRPQ